MNFKQCIKVHKYILERFFKAQWKFEKLPNIVCVICQGLYGTDAVSVDREREQER